MKIIDFVNFMEDFEKTAKGKAKEDFLVNYLNNINNEDRKKLHEIFNLVFSNSIKFNVNKRSFQKIFNNIDFASYKDVGEALYNNFNYTNIIFLNNDVMVLIDDVKKSLHYSGNKLLNYIKNKILSYNNNVLVKWFSRILMKNLFIDVGIRTFDKVFLSFGFSKFSFDSPMLCDKINDINEWNIFPVQAGIKYDGFRCIVKKENNVVTLISRQNKIVNGFLPELVEYFSNLSLNNFVLDGEVMANSFNDIQQRIGRKSSFEQVPGLHFRCFDIIKFNNIDLTDLSLLNRLKYLSFFHETDLFKFEEKKIINNKEELLDFYNTAVKNSEEGIVLKLLDSKYVFNSREYWFKVKPVKENTFQIIDFDYGNGKFKDTIGSIRVCDKNRVIVADVGRGLDDNVREELLFLVKNNNLIGKCVDVMYNEITKNKNGSFSLRFPRFLKLRFDKTEADEIKL